MDDYACLCPFLGDRPTIHCLTRNSRVKREREERKEREKSKKHNHSFPSPFFPLFFLRHSLLLFTFTIIIFLTSNPSPWYEQLPSVPATSFFILGFYAVFINSKSIFINSAGKRCGRRFNNPKDICESTW